MATAAAMATACRSPDIPRRPNGAIDWKTLGTLLTGNILGQVIEISYVDPHYGYQDEQFKPQTDWEYLYEEHNVVVLKKRTVDPGTYSYIGRTVLNWPFDELALYVDHMESTYQWDRLVTDIRYVEILNGSESHHDAIVYRCCEFGRCIIKAKVDFVYFVRSVHHDGKFVRTVRSIDHMDYPTVAGVIRGKFLAGTGLVLEPYRNDRSRTLVTYSYHVVIEGLPSILVNMALKKIPLSIRFIEPQRSHNDRDMCGLHMNDPEEGEEEFLGPSLSRSGLYEDSEPLVEFTKINGVLENGSTVLSSAKVSLENS